ncbi:MAG: T9SS type A sorting domain-containing protein [Bacteroidetes bacterium]|nr:T9SS type A sorting domain-containing protein [Bacteroidota bacterium]
MRNFFTLLGAICLTPFFSFSQIYINEDFSSGTGSTPPTGWSQTVIAGDPVTDLWRFDNPGGQALISPISTPAAIFDSDFLSDNNLPENVLLESPVFDASGASVVTLSFDHFFQSGFGGAYFVEVSNGTIWDTVLAGSSLSTNNPQHEMLDISSVAAGASNAQIRFRWEGDFSWFWILDNVIVYAPSADDLGVVSLEEPVSSCDPGPMAPVTINISNSGLNPESAFDLAFSVDGNPPVVEAYSGPPIPPGMTATYTFTAVADLSAPGFHTIQAYTILPGDGFPLNDTTTKIVEKFTTSAPFPLIENFNTYADGVTNFVDFTNSPDATRTFEVNFGPTGSDSTGPDGDAPGNGNGGYIYLEASGSNSGDYAQLNSHCLDLSSAQYPNLIFSRHLYGIDIDSFKVDVNQGYLVNLLTIIGDELSASSDPWVVDTFDLSAFIGTSVNLVFTAYVHDFQGDLALDNILIKEIAPVNAAVSTIMLPDPDCGLTTGETVSISLLNEGSLPVLGGSLTASFSVDMGPWSTPEVFPDTLQPGESGSFIFTSTANLSAPGAHEVTVAITLPGDNINANDTISGTTYTIPFISNFPYIEDFENGSGGWISGGMNSSWAFGLPVKNTITGAASGLYAWTTGGLGSDDYNSNEKSFVVSPCFDMTNLPANAWVALDIWWNSEYSWDGTVLQYSIDGGNIWDDLGEANEPYNWYNYDSSNVNSPLKVSWSGRASTSNGSGGWVQAQHPLDSALFGASDVLFRISFSADGSINDDGFAFDNFAIGVPPVAELGPDSLQLCIGDELSTGLADSVYTFLWSTGATTSFIHLQNTTGMTSIQKIWVMVTDSLGFVGTDTIVITIPEAAPMVSAVVDSQNLCHGDASGQATALGSGGVGVLTYSWNTNPAQNTPVISNLPAGTYEVTVTDENNCSATSSVVISEPEPLELTSISVQNEACPGDSSGFINVMLSGGTAPYQFSWDNGDTTQNLVGITVGTYVLSVIDSNQCTFHSPGFQIMAEDSLPVAEFSYMPVGVDYSVQFTGNSPNGNTYSWDFGDSTTSVDLSPKHEYQSNGEFVVTLTVSNECGSTSVSDSLNIMQVGLDESLGVFRLSVFPNPVHHSFNASVENKDLEEVVILLFTMDGRKVYENNWGRILQKQAIEVNLDKHLARGVYILRLVSKDGVVHRKIRLE